MGQNQSVDNEYQVELRRLQIEEAKRIADKAAKLDFYEIKKAASEAEKAAKLGAYETKKAVSEASSVAFTDFALFFGISALILDHFIRGTHHGRKLCIKARILFSPSRIFRPKMKNLIVDKSRAQIVANSLLVPLPTMIIGCVHS
jgi:hypothetical protein